MSELVDDLDVVATVGGFDDADAVVQEALRERLRRRPELRRSVAVEKYRADAVSLNRAAELAGCSTVEFEAELSDRGIEREAGFLDRSERERLLDEHEG